MDTPENYLYEAMQLEEKQSPVEIGNEEIKQHAKKNKLIIMPGIKNLHHIEPMSSSELSSQETEPTRFLLSPWLKERGISMIFAEPGVGKTLFALNCAYSLISGKKFLTFKPSQVDSVLYIDAESEVGDLKERWNMITKGKHFDGLRFYVASNFPDDVIPLISDEEGRKFYEEKMDKYKTKVVFFDNLSFLTCLDENKAFEWVPVLSWFKHLKNKGITVVFVHHTNKGGKDYRGSSKIKDLPNSVIYLEKIDDEDSSDFGARFNLKYEKKRHLMSAEESKQFEAFLDRSGNWQTKDSTFTNRQKAFDFFKVGMPVKEIADELKIHKSRVYIFKDEYDTLNKIKNKTKI